MAKPSSQKFIGRNRAPRVQIEYEVELYGAQKKVQVPFVMGVMADLSGKQIMLGVLDLGSAKVETSPRRVVSSQAAASRRSGK